MGYAIPGFRFNFQYNLGYYLSITEEESEIMKLIQNIEVIKVRNMTAPRRAAISGSVRNEKPTLLINLPNQQTYQPHLPPTLHHDLRHHLQPFQVLHDRRLQPEGSIVRPRAKQLILGHFSCSSREKRVLTYGVTRVRSKRRVTHC